MTKKLISLIFRNKDNKDPKKVAQLSALKRNKKIIQKEKQVSELINVRFGRALERLGDK